MKPQEHEQFDTYAIFQQLLAEAKSQREIDSLGLPMAKPKKQNQGDSGLFEEILSEYIEIYNKTNFPKKKPDLFK